MATIALIAAGSLLGEFGVLAGALGMAAGGIIGGVIDRELLFSPPDPSTPSIGDINYQSAEEGSPIFYAMGPEVSVSGALVWLSSDSPHT